MLLVHKCYGRELTSKWNSPLRDGVLSSICLHIKNVKEISNFYQFLQSQMQKYTWSFTQNIHVAATSTVHTCRVPTFLISVYTDRKRTRKRRHFNTNFEEIQWSPLFLQVENKITNVLFTLGCSKDQKKISLSFCVNSPLALIFFPIPPIPCWELHLFFDIASWWLTFSLIHLTTLKPNIHSLRRAISRLQIPG